MGTTFTLDQINQKLLLGTKGDDIVQGSNTRPWVWNGKRGVIRLLRGDDTIRSSSYVQINGLIDLGGGRDLITGMGQNSPIGQSAASLYAVDDFNGHLFMGRGRDKIFITIGGLFSGEDSVLDMGDGNDRINADKISMIGGFINTGDGDDRIDLGDGQILSGTAQLDLGAGDDVLIARGGIRLSDSHLSMGAGNDLVDVRNGLDLLAFGGPAKLGPGDDRIIGFAVIPSQDEIDSGMLIGGKGKDTIVLQEGVYEISSDRISTAETFLPVAGMNFLEGINGGRFAYAPGILTVNDQGVASFASDL